MAMVVIGKLAHKSVLINVNQVFTIKIAKLKNKFV